MNKVYKSKWNNASGQWVAVSELVKGKSKNSRLCKGILSSALVTVGIATGSLAYAGVINNSADKSTTASGAYPISDIVTNGSATEITNTGSLSTQADNTNAIYVSNSSGNVVIINAGVLSTQGDAANVLDVKSLTGNISIDNTGYITATGQNSIGILASTGNGVISIDDLGSHVITSSSSGIRLQAGNASSTVGGATVNSNAQIITNSGSSTTINNASGVDALAANYSVVNYNGPGISVTSRSASGTAQIIGIRSAVGFSTGVGDSSVTASGNIDVNLNDGAAHLAYGIESLNIGFGDANVHYKSGTINVNANNSTVDFGRGLLAQNSGAAATGSAKIVTDEGTQIHTVGNYIDAIGITSQAGSAANGKVVYADINSTITTNGETAYGIRAVAGKDALIDVTNRGGITTQNINSYAISLTSSSGDINAVNMGHISTLGANSIGIIATNNGARNTHLYNEGTVETSGTFAFGIEAIANNQGNIEITNNGQVITNNASGHGIYANRGTSGGDVTINNNGVVHITGPIASRAILVRDSSSSASTVTINNAGVIIHDVEADGHYGIDALVKGNVRVVVNNSGSIKGGQFGIVVWSGSAPNTDAQGIINIGSTGRVDSGNALTMDLSNSNTMNIAAGAVVNGWRNALLFRTDSGVTPINTVNNAGTVTSELDKLLSTRYNSAGIETIINNAVTGNMSGFITTDKTDVTVNNAGLWNVRNFADSTGDHVRDTKSVAISNFGSGTNTVNNTGTLNLSAVSGETSVNNAGEYIPIGALSITHAGTVQGQLLNLNTFDNSGLIDMTANNQAGDVLVITGGGTAGVNGEGTYISNGGSLKLNTLLNQGGQASQTDILVLDNIQLGTNGATKVYVSPAIGSLGAYTPGDGIKIIETLGNQDTRAFTLGQPLLSGAYEYQLFAYDAQGTQNGFYLRSQLNNDPLYNPNIGSYLGNQYATSTMFNQNILDRRNSVRNTNKNIWMRTNYNETRYDQLGGRQHTKTDNTLVQAGIDIIRHQDFTAGAYIGYGQSRTKNHSNQTGTRANAKANGYQVGLYGTWMPDQNQGPYVDTWAHYAWYKNKLEGQAQQNDNVKYDSHGYALSVEAGYGFNLATTQSGRMWIIQPHAQIIYNNLKTKNFTDNNYTYFANQSASGISTRLGARFYGQEPADKQGILPFVEANWLHNGVKNKVKLGGSNVDEKIGQNVGELKLGINGQVNNKVSIFGHIGGQLGSHDYKRGEVQIGFNVNW